MSLKWISTAIVVVMLALGYVAWRGNTQKAVPAAESSAPAAGEPTAEGQMAHETADPGIAWDPPAGWTAAGERPMRLATYEVPGAPGAGEASCAVYYFGPGQGGTPAANLERWTGEFENPGKADPSVRDVHGVRVSRIHVRGRYTSHGSSMGGEAHGGEAPQADYALLGAIAEAPGGSVFFKLTGPAATVDHAARDFDRMLGSIRKKEAS